VKQSSLTYGGIEKEESCEPEKDEEIAKLPEREGQENSRKP
jgi:hypothetical protein